MAQRVIGLDVGTSAVRAAEVVLETRPRLVRFGQVGLGPDAMSDGEVLDPGAVAAALRRLWKEAGFRGRDVRLGVSSARVILRVVDVPALSTSDTRSVLRLQLGEYVPLPVDKTVFDFLPLEHVETSSGAQQRVLLAAAHEDVVRPLLDAVRRAGLKPRGIDALPAALARAVALSHTPDDVGRVDAVVSVGAGTVLVLVARDGVPVFARTVTAVAGRHLTERLAADLGISLEEAERAKRLAGTANAGEQVAVVAAPVVTELATEVQETIGYYEAQRGATPVQRVHVTGGGAGLHGLVDTLAGRLLVPVAPFDPFGHVELGPLGFDAVDLPYLAPHLPAALGLALGGRAKERRLDLVPEKAAAPPRDRTGLVVGGVALALTAGVGALWWQGRQAVGEAQDEARQAQEALAAAEEALADRLVPQGASPADVRPLVVLDARLADVDWVAVRAALDASSAPLGVSILSFSGTAQVVLPTAATDPAATAGTVRGFRVDDTGAAGDPSVAATTDTGVPTVGDLSVIGEAPDLTTIAAWLDELAADPRFTDAWVTAVSPLGDEEAATGLQFTARASLTSRNLVDRPELEVRP